MRNWHLVENAEDVPTPVLLVYPDRIRSNLARMVAMSDDPARLRPHVKTHKMRELVRMQMELGITRFKCATMAEMEMTASCGAKDVLLAFPPVGPNIGRLLSLMRAYPAARFSVVADDAELIAELGKAACEAGSTIELLLDLDVGMHRTGVAPDDAAAALYRQISSVAGLRPGGLHAYDGHIQNSDVDERFRACEEAMVPVRKLQEGLCEEKLPVPRVVAGGTPTFPIHAHHGDVECSPGTCVLWDAGYGSKFPDLGFQSAAVVMTRVISRPAGRRLCLDLGHKAIASEMPHPRVRFLGLPDAKPVMHSEEHLVMETAGETEFPIGACLYGIPWHICPTIALHAEVVVVEQGRAERRWEVAARNRTTKIEPRMSGS